MLDVVLTIINVILAVVSAFGAWNSIKYFRKSKNLTIFAQTNKALVEVQNVNKVTRSIVCFKFFETGKERT